MYFCLPRYRFRLVHPDSNGLIPAIRTTLKIVFANRHINTHTYPEIRACSYSKTYITVDAHPPYASLALMVYDGS